MTFWWLCSVRRALWWTSNRNWPYVPGVREVPGPEEDRKGSWCSGFREGGEFTSQQLQHLEPTPLRRAGLPGPEGGPLSSAKPPETLCPVRRTFGQDRPHLQVQKCSLDSIFLVTMWIHHSCAHYLRLNIDFWLISESWPQKGAQVRGYFFLPVLHQGYFGIYSLVNVLCWLASTKVRFLEWKLALMSSRDHKIFSFKTGIWLKAGLRALRTSHCFTVDWWLSEHLVSFIASLSSSLKCPFCINSGQTELSM